MLAALDALDTAGGRGLVAPEVLDDVLRDAAVLATRALAAWATLADDDGPLIRALGDEIDLARRLVIAVLALRHGDGIRAAVRVVDHGEGARRALAVEALDVALSRAEAAVALPLVRRDLPAEERTPGYGAPERRRAPARTGSRTSPATRRACGVRRGSPRAPVTRSGRSAHEVAHKPRHRERRDPRGASSDGGPGVRLPPKHCRDGMPTGYFVQLRRDERTKERTVPHTTRRELLASGGTAALVMAVSDATPAAAASVPPIVRLDAVQLSKQIRERQISCREVMVDYLDHIEGSIRRSTRSCRCRIARACIAQAPERDAQLARGEYLGLMHGFPHAVKDLGEHRRHPHHAGVADLQGQRPTTDAIFVERSSAAGAIIIGKTNTPEFGLGSQTYNTVFGTTLQRVRPDAGPRAAAAAAPPLPLALRMVPVADGSDFMGSLRNPAAWNNVFGFRPSFGRVPFGPTGEVFAQSWATTARWAARSPTSRCCSRSWPATTPRAPMSLEEDSVRLRPLAPPRLPAAPGSLSSGTSAATCRSSRACSSCAGARSRRSSAIGVEVVDALPAFDPGRVWDSFTKLRYWLVGGRLFALYDDPPQRALMKPEAQFEIEESSS